MKKIIALLLALSFIFAFAACGNDSDTVTTTQAAEETDAPQVTLPEETSAVEETDAAATEAVDETTAAPETTTEVATTLAGVEAPVGNDIAKIVDYYNTAVNAANSYSGTMKVNRVQGTVSTLESVSIELARGIVEGVLPNDYPQNETKTFTNGKASDGEKASEFLPVDDQSYSSKLTPAGVKSATCTKQGNGYKVSITLVSENGNDINFVPKHHGSCCDTLALTQEDLDPLTINQCNITYTGAQLNAVIDEYGKVTSLTISEPVVIEGKVAWKSFNIIDVQVLGTWKQEFTISY